MHKTNITNKKAIPTPQSHGDLGRARYWDNHKHTRMPQRNTRPQGSWWVLRGTTEKTKKIKIHPYVDESKHTMI